MTALRRSDRRARRQNLRAKEGEDGNVTLRYQIFLRCADTQHARVSRRFLQPPRCRAFNFKVIQSFKGKAIYLARRSGFLPPLPREHSILRSPVADLYACRRSLRRFAPNQAFT
jgi:hypothetical protein